LAYADKQTETRQAYHALGPINLSHNLALEGLLVELEMYSTSVDALVGVSQSLDRIRFPNLQRIHIILNLFSSKSDIWTAKWWRLLGDAFRNPCFNRLEVLDISAFGHRPPDVVPEGELPSLASTQLGFLAKRGVELSLEVDEK
jgi:hypothetical protein